MNRIARRTTRAALALLMAATAAVGTTATSAEAATYNVKWPTRTVYVYVDSNVSGYWHTSEAIKAWDGYGIRVVRTTNPRAAKIFIHQGRVNVPRKVAWTTFKTKGWYLSRVDITLDPDWLKASYCNRAYVPAHEMGHAMGLNHNSFSRTSLMLNVWPTYCKLRPNLYDQSEARSLYR